MSDNEKLLAELAGLRADLAAVNARPPTEMDRAAFHALDAGSRMDFARRGGKVTDAAPTSTAIAAIDLERHRRGLHEARETVIRSNLSKGIHAAPATKASTTEAALRAAAAGDLAGARAMVKDRGAAFAVLRAAPAIGRQIVPAAILEDWDRSAAFVN